MSRINFEKWLVEVQKDTVSRVFCTISILNLTKNDVILSLKTQVSM
jgi:hypothetical protein